MKKISLSAFVFLLVFLFSTCEIGLGASVDTEAPVISVLRPSLENVDVIKGSFPIMGDWSDDGAIDSIKITLKGNDGIEHEYTAPVDKAEGKANEGTWYCAIDPVADKITDGSYSVEVVIKDKAGHKTASLAQIVIDNTAPIVVLTRPSTSAQSSSFDTYGQTFTLEGQAADTNNISRIDVHLYEDADCTISVGTVSLPNVPNSINMDAAKYNAEKESYINEQNSDFAISVPKDSDGKQFYCQIVAYDGAIQYPMDGSEPSGEYLNGNSINSYYLYKDISTSILQNYKITEVYSMLSGTYSTDTNRAAAAGEVLKLLDDKKIEVGKFALNPRNNPTFSVTGRSPLAMDGNDFKGTTHNVSNGQSLVVEVSPGLDGILLEESSIKVYAILCDDKGNPAAGASKIYPATTKSESGTSYRFVTPINLSDGFAIGKNYVIGVEGYDQSEAKNAIIPASKGYGFHMATTGKAPTLTLTSPDSTNTYINTASQLFKGSVTVEVGAPTIVFTKDGKEIKRLELPESSGVAGNNEITYPFEYTFTDFGTTSGNHKFTITAVQDTLVSQAVERTVVYDVETPTISITAPATAKKFNDDGTEDTSKKYVNGNISFTVVLNDKGGAGLDSSINKPKWEILDATTKAVIDSGYITEPTGQIITKDTTDAKLNGKKLIIRVTVYDIAGNKTVSDDSEYTYTVDQSTDIPRIFVYTPSELNERPLDFELDSISDYDAQPKTDKKGTVTRGDYLKFYYYDDDGNVKITIRSNKISSDTNWISDVTQLTSVYDKSKDVKVLSLFDEYQFPKEESECGTYELAITLTDGNKTTTVGPFVVNVTKESASLLISSTPEYAKDGDKFTNTITIVPSIPDYEIYRKFGENDYETTAWKTVSSTATADLTFDDEIVASTLTEDEVKVTYKVIDGNNQTSKEVFVTLRKDNDAPETPTFTAPVVGKTKKSAISDDEYTFKGTLNDSKSGIAKLWYCFTNSATAPSEISAYTYQAASDGSFTIEKTIDDGRVRTTATTENLCEGEWYLHIKAEDKAGNISSPVSRQFDIDKKAPVLTENNSDDLGYKNASFTLSGTVEETNGLESIIIKDDKDTSFSVELNPTSADNKNYTWTTGITGLSDGKHTLTITAKDKATNETPLKRFVTVDTVAPVVASSMTLPTGKSFDAATITINGTATDASPSSGFAKVEYWFADGTGDNAKKSNVFDAEGTSYWSATISRTELNNSSMGGVFDAQGEKYIFVKAYDNAGNPSATVSNLFVYDTENPVLSDEKLEYTAGTAVSLSDRTLYTNKNNYTVSGNFSDTGSNVTVSVTSNGQDVTVTQTDNSMSGAWSFTTSGLSDNTYRYIITAADRSGRTDEKQYSIIVDKTAPVISITKPGNVDEYINSTAYTFTGTITEVNLKTLTAKLYKAGVTEPVNTEVLYPVNGRWNWTVTNLDNAEYTIKLEAEDEAGNTATVISEEKVIVDTVKPTISFISDGSLYDMSGDKQDADAVLTADSTYFTKGAFTLKGTANDANFDAASIKVGETKKSFTSGGSASGAWTYSQAGTDGEYVYTIAATDKANNPASATITVKVDTSAPDKNEITAPANATRLSAISETTYIFKGNAKDKTGGTGVSKILYAFTNSSTAPTDDSAYTEQAASDGGWSIPKTINSGTAATENTDNLYEGNWYLHVKAKDLAGNVTSAVSKAFDIDFENPSIETKLDSVVLGESTEQGKNAAYTFTFKITESNKLDATNPVSITIKKDNVALTSNDYSLKQGETTISALTSVEKDKEYTIVIPDATDALYTYVITAKDLVGKTTTVTRNIRLDTTAPVISVSSPEADTWQSSNNFNVIGTAADSSGTQAVYYVLNPTTVPAIPAKGTAALTVSNWTGWNADAKGKDNWNISLSDVVESTDANTHNILYLAAVDTMGNVSTSAKAVTLKVDTAEPTLTPKFYQIQDADLAVAISDADTIYVNNADGKSVTIYGEYKNAKSGVNALTINGATVTYSTSEITNEALISSATFAALPEDKTTVKSWKAVFTSLSEGNNRITLNGSSVAGIQVSKTCNIIRDITKPSIPTFSLVDSSTEKKQYSSPSTGDYYVNNTVKTGETTAAKKFTLSGTASDTYGIASVTISGVTADFSGTKENWKFKEFEIQGSDGDYVSIEVIVTDKAGNIKKQPITVNIDTVAPKGKHVLDSANKDLYFRIGDQDRDVVNGTTTKGKITTVISGAPETIATTTDGKGKDQKVGGKYAGNTYGDTETITLRGRFDDEGSGVERIYYKVVQTSPDDSGIADVFLASYETLADGYFLLSGDETKRVFYTDGDSKIGEGDGTIKRKADGTWVDKEDVNCTGTFNPVNGSESGSGPSTKVTITTTDSSTETPTVKYQFYSDVTTNYKTVISNFMPGENYLMFVAVDNVGNADYETVEYMGVKHHDYRINIDQVTPNIENTNEVKYSNGKLTIDIDGKVNDALAGIASMEVYTTIPKVKGKTEKKKITFDVTLTDNGDEHPATTDATVTDEVKNSRYKLWTANIDTSTITYDDGTLYDGTVSLNATARDNAGKGNPATVGIGSIIMDIKPTNVSLTAPTDADEYTNECQVNGTISLSGTAKDENGLSADSGSLVLYYTRNTTLGAKTKTTIAAADIKADNDTDATYTPDTHFVKLDDTVANDTSWTFSNIDTASLKKSTTKNEETEKVWFMVASKDIAGNFGYSDPCAVIVDPHSDRPVILFEEGITLASDMASLSPSWVKNRQIKGKVKDDDGVTHLYYSFTGNESDWSSDCLDSDKRGFTINLNSNGSDDDKHTIYFKVVTADGEYITKAASSSYDALSTPKLRTNDQTNDENNVIIGNDSENDKYDTTLYVNIDLKNPDILVKHYTVEDLSEYFAKENGSYKVDNIDTALIANNQPNTSFEWKELKSSFTTGGPSSYLYVLVKATDANGINSITLKEGTTEITGDNKREKVDGRSTTALFRIDISSINVDASDKELEITVTDKANKPVTNSSTVTIDRKAPVVTITTPSSGSSVYGNEGVPSGSVTVSGNTSDGHHVSKVYFAITTGENDQPVDDDPAKGWTDMTTENATAIYAIFNGDTGNDRNGVDAYYGELFNDYVNALYGAGISVRDDRKNVCLWFYAEDEYGNAGKENPTKLPLLVLTQGDKPEVKISYPEMGAKVGGTITLSGSTSIATDTVDKVYIQIDPNYPEITDENKDEISDGHLFSTTNWESSMTTIMSGRTDLGYEIVNVTGISGTANADKTKAIVAHGSAQSWYLNINMQHEFDKENDNSYIAVRVFAVGKNNGKVSNVQTVAFKLDPDSPIFGNKKALRLVKYSDNVNGTGTETASLLYTKDMWIKGKWWLTGSIEDNSGISALTLTEKEGAQRSETTIANLIKSGNDGIITGGYILNIPVGVPEGSENCYAKHFDIVATDGENPATQDIILNYDNDAPTFSANLNVTGNSIVQSQGSYSISGSFNDGTGSGFKRIAFYVTRTLSGKSYLTDIMSKQGTTDDGIPKNCIEITNAFTAPASGAADLYWQTITGCTANSTEITLPSNESVKIPSYVHVGGLCRINNVLYRIEGVNESTKTITIDQKINSGTVAVEFTVAQVIDNTVSESGVTTFFGDETNLIANDDDDYMCESYSNSDGSWSVTINSKNIKDGAITLHFVAYDKAGNAIATDYGATVANNRPRIAGVKFGSDVDGSGTVENTEMKTMYSGIYRQGHDNHLENVTVSGQTPAGKPIYTLAIPNNSTKIDTLYGKPVLTVKGKVKVVPEIVGGNDGLSWTYYIGSSKSDDNIVKVNGARKVTTIVNTHSDDIRVDDEGNDIETAINLELGDIVGHYTDDGPNDFHFQIWDHTEGLICGETSNRADLSLRFYIALKDGDAPTANIRPFYWIDSEDENNSVVYEPDSEEATKNVAKGHIELSDDLPSDTFNVASTDSSGLYDNDPKVSGIIYLEGTARDNVVVEEILMKFPGLTSGTGFVPVAKRDRTSGSANYGKWKAVTTLDDDGFEFVEATETTDTDSSTGLDYNVVNFKIKVNTAEITGTAGTDKQIQVQVKDRGGITAVSNNVPTYSGALESSVTTGQTKVTEMTWLEAKNLTATKYRDLKLTDKIDTKEKLDTATIVYVDERTPTYKVDVVPYITKITTPERNSSGLKDENIRSASGRYSVIKGSTTSFIKVEGFNLNVATGGARIISGSDVSKTNLDENSGTAIAFSNKAEDYTSVYLSNNISKSGYLEIFAGTEKIRTLNNINKTDAHGSYTITGKDKDGNSKASASDWENFYNREPDFYKTNNIQLTDDRYLLGWDMKTTTIKNGYYPDMIVNKKNTTDGSGNIVFSYLNPTGGVGNMSYKANFQPQRAVVTVGTGATKSTENLIGGMAWDQMAMAQDGSGRYVHVTSYNYNEANMSLIYDRFAALSMTAYYHGITNYYDRNYSTRTQTYGGWGSGTFWSGQYLTPSHVGNNNALTLDSVNYSSLLLDRYKNLRLIAQGNSTSSTDPARVYIGFYDDNSGTVYFRNMKIAADPNLGNQLYNGNSKASDGGSYSQYTNFNENTYDPESDNSKNWTTGKSTVGTSATEHFDIGVDSNKVAIVVYYGADGYLHLKYKTGVDGSSPNTALTFSENKDVTFPKGVGQYVSMAIDASNGIHIAAFDVNTSDLRYIYMTAYNAKTYTSMIVDAAGSVGNWTSIKIDTNSDHSSKYYNKPVIAYYNSTETGGRDTIKLATANATIGSVTAGVDESTNYTSTGWEYMTVPSITPAQGGNAKFRHVNLDFDAAGNPVVGYLGAYLEYGQQVSE